MLRAIKAAPAPGWPQGKGQERARRARARGLPWLSTADRGRAELEDVKSPPGGDSGGRYPGDPGEVSDPCPGQDSTQSEGEFGVRDTPHPSHLCPSSHALGAMVKFWLSLPSGARNSRECQFPSRGIAGIGHRSLLLAFPGLGGGREQQYRYREIIERAE